MKKLKVFSLTLLCLVLLASVAAFVKLRSLYDCYQPAHYQSTPGYETAVSLENPFRGFYRIRRLTLSEDEPDTVTDKIRRYIDSDDLQLMLIEINLSNYASSDLSDNALQQLDHILSELAAARRQVILRFLYDWDGNALETEPDTIEQLIRHMDQVAFVVNRYEDTVFLMQGTFTGSWGEMHNTHYGSHEHNRLLMTHLSEAISPSIFLAVRTPSQLRGVLNTRDIISEENAFDGSLAARLGLFNDGMLGSESDLGTYDNTPNADTTEPEDKGTRQEEIAYQNILCQFVPNGGEVVIDNPYNDFDNAPTDLRDMHVSYLNSAYDAAVLEKWASSTYRGTDCFDGMSGYDYIEAHLGYRYVLPDSFLTYDAMDPSAAELSFAIQNTGFAPAYRQFNGSLTLEQTDTGTVHSFPVDLDNRLIGGGEEKDIVLSLDLSELPEGDYLISFTLSDPYTVRPIQFASDNAAANGSVSLGVLTIETKSPKEFLSYLLAYL